MQIIFAAIFTPRRFRSVSRDPSHRSYGRKRQVAELFFMRAHSTLGKLRRLFQIFRGINRGR